MGYVMGSTNRHLLTYLLTHLCVLETNNKVTVWLSYSALSAINRLLYAGPD